MDGASCNLKVRQCLAPDSPRKTCRRASASIAVDTESSRTPWAFAGLRETQQHRDWIGVYKAHDRLARRERGQCERCEAPASDGVVFCELHRAGGAGGAGLSSRDRQAILEAQARRCPICAEKVGLRDILDQARGRDAFLHVRCSRFVTLAEGLGPESVDRLRTYLWSRPPGKPRRA
jgi:hypothetical protein